MLIKIIIYYLIIFGLLYEGRKLRLLDQIFDPVTIVSMIFFIYVGSYLLLLGLEIRDHLSKRATEKEIRKAAFWFSFWAGTCWGILPTFYHGCPEFQYSLKETLFVFLGCAIAGSLIGGIGVALSYIIVPFLEKAKTHMRK